jgi:hypothetical protein
LFCRVDPKMSRSPYLPSWPLHELKFSLSP